MSDKEQPTGPSDTVKDMAKVIQKAMSLDSKTGVIAVEDGLYKTCLPEGLTPDTVRVVHDHEHKFVAASALAVSNIGLKAMKSHADLTEVTAHVPMSGRNYTDVHYARSREFPNIKDSANPDAKPIVSHGVLTMKMHSTSGSNTGEVGRVRAYAKQMAAEALGSK